MNEYNKIWSVLTLTQRRKVFKLFVLLIVGIIFETGSIGLIIPVLTIVVQENLSDQFPLLSQLFLLLGNPTHEKRIVYSLLFLLFIYVIKSLYLVFLVRKQSKFVHQLQADLSLRLFSIYLNQPYTFHLQHNSSHLIRNILGEVLIFTNCAIHPFILLLTEIPILFGICVMLIYLDPMNATLLIGILSTTNALFFFITRHYISNWGRKRQLHDGLRMQFLQQGLSGIKDIKLLGREDYFLLMYQQQNNIIAEIAQNIFIIQSLPRLWLEVLFVSGLSGTALFMIGQGRSLTALLPTLGLSSASAFRILPLAGRVINARQSIRFASSAIQNMCQELQRSYKTFPHANQDSLPFNYTIHLEHIFFQYTQDDIYILNDVNLLIKKGSSVAIVGESGAGKSTLLDVLLGLLSPQMGSVKVDGVDIRTNIGGWQKHIGYVSQNIFLTDDTIRRNIAFGIPDSEIKDSAVWKAVESTQMDLFIQKLPQGLDTKVGERGVCLSGGQRQRIGIARALYHEPAILVLDEATNALDTSTEKEVMESIISKKGDKTIIVVSHRFSQITFSDLIYNIDTKKIIDNDYLNKKLEYMPL